MKFSYAEYKAIIYAAKTPHLLVQHFERTAVERLEHRSQQVESPRLHRQLALGLQLEHGQVVVQLRLLLSHGHMVSNIT